MEKAERNRKLFVTFLFVAAGLIIMTIGFIGLGNVSENGSYYQKRQTVCNTACVDRRTQITDNKCYCLNGNDWVYKIDLEK